MPFAAAEIKQNWRRGNFDFHFVVKFCLIYLLHSFKTLKITFVPVTLLGQIFMTKPYRKIQIFRSKQMRTTYKHSNATYQSINVVQGYANLLNKYRLVLWTGAKTEEICQLKGEQVKPFSLVLGIHNSSHTTLL